MKCEVHPDIETNIGCATCGRPVCPKCMIYTPVGVKCADCARLTGRIVAGPRPIYYFRAIGAGLGAAVFGGILLFEVARIVRFGSMLLVIFLGMAIGEAVSRGAGRNTGRTFQIIAGVSAALAFLVAGYLTGSPLVTLRGWHGISYINVNPIRLLIALLGIYLATARLKD